MNDWEKEKQYTRDLQSAYDWMLKNQKEFDEALRSHGYNPKGLVSGDHILRIWREKTQPDREPRPITEAIHWTKKDKLDRHLSILKREGFISLTNAQPEFIKHPRFKSIDINILALFWFWDEAGYIDGFITKEDPAKGIKEEWHYDYIIDSFTKKGGFKANDLKAAKYRMKSSAKPPVYSYLAEVLTR